jgi:hypothetical protein
MSNRNLEMGLQPLQWEFIPVSNPSLILSSYEESQHEAISAILYAIFKKKYECSQIFNFKSWTKSKTRMIFKFDPIEDPEDPSAGVKDRSKIQEFISDIRRMKSVDDEIYFSVWSVDTDDGIRIDSALMSFHIPDILPYLSALLDNVPESAGILQEINRVASSYLRAANKHLPQYNI